MTATAGVVATTARAVPRKSSVTTESPLVRWTLIAVTLAFLGVFLVLPLVLVFAEALAKGLAAYGRELVTPDAVAAIRLTLLAAGIAVPLNLVFGIAAA